MAKKKSKRKIATTRTRYTEWLTEEGLTKLKGYARDGYTDEEIANIIGIARSTLYTWKKKYADIDNALKAGKEIIDYEIEEALIKSALGHEVEEKKITNKYERGEVIGTEVQVHKKYVPPNVTALIFYLKNRQPNKWRDTKEQTITAQVKTSAYDELTADELRALIDLEDE